MKLRVFTTSLLLTYAFLITVHAQTTRIPLILNGTITSLATCGDTVFVSGSFTKASNPDSIGKYGTTVDSITGKHDSRWPKPNETVNAAIPDGNGGFYIGGNFTEVGGQPRNRIAHIDQSGVVTSLFAGITINGEIQAMELKNDVLYIGGSFTSVTDVTSTKTRNRLAAYNILSSEFTPWDPNVGSGSVNVLAIKDTSVYVGGTFTSINSISQGYFAALSIYTGKKNAWNPNLNALVAALAVSGDTVFVGGNFITFSGQTRNRVAAFTDTSLIAWNPDADNQVRAIAVLNNTVYVSGTFLTIGGALRTNIAAIERATGLATSWNPAPSQNTAINVLTVRNNIVYAGGNFTQSAFVIGGQIRNRIVALDANVDTAMALPWYPAVEDVFLECIAFSGGKTFLGGPYTIMGSTNRNRYAAFRASTGELLDWTVNANTSASYMLPSREHKRVYISGSGLNSIDGITVTRLAALDMATGSLIPTWVPEPNSDPRAMATIGGLVYIAGNFGSVNTIARNRIAALDTATGALTSFNPNANSSITSLAVKGDTLFVGGGFTSISAQTRNRLAAYSSSTGNLLTTWNPSVTISSGSASVNAMVIHNNLLYFAGAFTSVGGQARNRLACVSIDNGTLSSWNPNSNSTVDRIVAINNAIYVSGAFTTIGGSTKSYIAAIDATTGALASGWTATGITAAPLGLAVYGSEVFTTGTAPAYIRAIKQDASLPVTFKNISAQKQGSDVKIEWSTASEQNNDYFEVERSADGSNFIALNRKIHGAGTSNMLNTYAYLDMAPFDNKAGLYYRIKQVDFDGHRAYSKAVYVNSNPAGAIPDPLIYPNPAKDRLTIDFRGIGGNKTISIYNMEGHLALNVSTSAIGEESISLVNQPKGVYIINIRTEQANKVSKFAIVE